MKRIRVEVRDDHLELLSRAKPLAAVAELIWNSLDAEATRVRVEFDENPLGGVDAIRVVDNGRGLAHEDAARAFSNLGGSWKEEGQRSPEMKRLLHGKFGKGRFRAFALGNHVRWDSVYRDDDGPKAFHIEGRAEHLGEFDVSEPQPAPEKAEGMVCTISDLTANAAALRGMKAAQDATDVFALYLRQYPGAQVVFDGIPLDPATSEDRRTEYDLGEVVMETGERVHAELEIVEWLIPGKRGIVLCDAAGFALHTARPNLVFRGFSYTAYLKSAHLAVLDKQGLLQMEELSPDVRQLLDLARRKLREHFTLREAERAADVLARWKESGLYPYEGEAVDAEEESERRVFDIYATHLNQIADFSSVPPRTKRLLLRMLQELVRVEPVRAAHLLDETLTFPEDKEEAVLNLLQTEQSGD
jgi:hypothetical protein